MDFAELLSDSWGYTRDGVINNTTRWMKLIFAVLCLGLPFNGYILRVYRGITPAPEIDDWGTLFLDGLKVFAIAFVYIIPLILVMLLLFCIMLIASPGGNISNPSMHSGPFESLFTLFIYFMQFVVAAILPVACIRFARTGDFFEAFNFNALFATIGKIGWINYIVAVVFIGIIVSIPLTIVIFALMFVLIFALILFNNNPFMLLLIIAILAILFLIIIPLISIFEARYMTRVYETSGE